MENIRRWSCLKIVLLKPLFRSAIGLLCGFLPCTLAAQTEFDKHLDFDEIRLEMKNGEGDIRQQGLAWYHFAHYEDRKFGDSDSAFSYLANSTEYFLRAKDSAAYYRAKIDLADWLANSGLLQQVFEMDFEALNYAKQSQNKKLEALVLIRLSRNYMKAGDTSGMLEYRRKFRDVNTVLKDTLLELGVLFEEVNRLKQAGRNSEAITLSKRTLALAQKVGDQEAIAWAEYKTGNLLTISLDYKNALGYLRQAAAFSEYAEETLQRNIYQDLAKTFTALDNTEQAYVYAMKFAVLTDAILTRNQEAERKEAAKQADIKEKQGIIEKLKQKNADVETRIEEQRLWFALLAVALAAVSLAMFFIIRDYRHRLHTNRVIAQQNEEINQQKIRELEDSLKIETMQSMLQGQERERERIAHDLHDSIGGLLAAAKLQVENLSTSKSDKTNEQQALKIKALLDETVAETRQISRNLSPRSLSKFGLVNTLQDLTGRVSNPSGPAITFQSFGDFSGLEEQFALICYRIVQELLQNSLKHAQATEILVQITRTDTGLAVLVEDDGRGFDPETVQQGMGTGNIAQRVQFLKGDISIHAAPGQGTSTLVTIPI